MFRISRRIKIYVIIFIIVFICFAFFLLIDALHRVKGLGWAITCENTLRAVGHAFEAYKSDHEGTLPSSLLELKDYMKEKYTSDSSGIPISIGNIKNEAGNSSYYIYNPSLSSDANRPICWDSTPHRISGRFLPDVYVWNVLYANGNVERLYKRKFLSLMNSIGIREPNNPSNKSSRP